jgi:hypothetical protein
MVRCLVKAKEQDLIHIFSAVVLPATGHFAQFGAD